MTGLCPVASHCWIAFIDLVDSSSFANVLGLKSYYEEILQPYHRLAEAVRAEVLGSGSTEPFRCVHYFLARGDEALLVIPADPTAYPVCEEVSRIAAIAFRYCITLKSRWLLSSLNSHRAADQRPLVDIAVGVHCGELIWPDPEGLGSGTSPEGFPLTYCKRIESAAREATSRMTCSAEGQAEAVRLGLPECFFESMTADLKGLSTMQTMFAFGCGDPDQVRSRAGSSFKNLLVPIPTLGGEQDPNLLLSTALIQKARALYPQITALIPRTGPQPGDAWRLEAHRDFADTHASLRPAKAVELLMRADRERKRGAGFALHPIFNEVYRAGIQHGWPGMEHLPSFYDACMAGQASGQLPPRLEWTLGCLDNYHAARLGTLGVAVLANRDPSTR